MMWASSNYTRLVGLCEEMQTHIRAQHDEIEKLRSAISELRSAMSLQNSTPSELRSRIEDIELWRGKIHAMLVEKTPTGQKEKLTQRGKGFSAIYNR